MILPSKTSAEGVVSGLISAAPSNGAIPTTGGLGTAGSNCAWAVAVTALHPSRQPGMPATSPVNTAASNAAKTTLAARARRGKLTDSLQGSVEGSDFTIDG